MSAVPKKKLCWNCEGNIVTNIDNCPYCGVYVHSSEMDEINDWHAPYTGETKTEEIPSPFYKLHPEQEIVNDSSQVPENTPSLSLFEQLKKDVLPTLLLMAGSVFFLFGLVLVLFSHEGTLTLQWNGNLWPYFLIGSIIFIAVGWILLFQNNQDENQDLDES